MPVQFAQGPRWSPVLFAMGPWGAPLPMCRSVVQGVGTSLESLETQVQRQAATIEQQNARIAVWSALCLSSPILLHLT